MGWTNAVKRLVTLSSLVVTMVLGCGAPSGITRQDTGSSVNIDEQTPIRLTVPRGHFVTGEDRDGGVIAAGYSSDASLPVVQPGTRGAAAQWLNQALALLKYLPIQFVPYDTEPASRDIPAASQLAAKLDAGTLTPLQGQWKWSAGYPASLVQLWEPNAATVLTQGAVMSFQKQHHLDVDGVAGPQVYQALLQALRGHEVNAHDYVYVTVSKSGTEHLDVWKGAQRLFSSLANTGISACPTPNGTWPVFMRYTSQTMQGTAPNGEKYADAGVPWVSYFYQGCAIHGFPRASYGWPQSLGCVELPLQAAEKVYNLLDYGTLVTVQS